MIAPISVFHLQKRRADGEALAVRVAIVRATRLAQPGLSLSDLADRLGLSRGQLYHCLGYRLKVGKPPPPWAPDLYAAAGFLAQGDEAAAGKRFRILADTLCPP